MKLKLAILGVLAVPMFAAAPYVCTGSVSTPVNANVVVPAGAYCLMYGDVHGNVTAEGDFYGYGIHIFGSVTGMGSLVYLGPDAAGTTPTIVEGDVTLRNTTWFWINGVWGGTAANHSVIKGNLSGMGGASYFAVTYTTIGGDVNVSGHSDPAYPTYLYVSEVGRNANFNNNSGKGLLLLGNHFGKDLICVNNSVVEGQGNTVDQNANAQCSAPGLATDKHSN